MINTPQPVALMTCRGLKCDAPGCDYKEKTTELTAEAIMAAIGRPCPKCGANLLTAEDAQAMLSLQAVAAAARTLLNIQSRAGVSNWDKPIAHGYIHSHATGETRHYNFSNRKQH